MGVRVRHEIERREGGIAGIDADLLDPERDENGPQHIRELRREDQHRERRAWRTPFGRQGHDEVSYKQRGTTP